MLENIIDGMMEAAKKNAAPCAEDYTGEDGLLYCGKCRTPKQFFMPEEMHRFIENRRGWCMCACQTAKEQEREEEERRQKLLRLAEENRRIGIPDLIYRKMCFENDDSPDSLLSRSARRYAESFTPATEQKGLLFMGGVGTGKTFLACCIANRVIDRGMTAIVSTPAPLIRQISDYRQADDTLRRISETDLLVLDDMGTLRDSEYNNEKLFELIDTRYRSGKPMIVTTNLSADDFDTATLSARRIYDRIAERCRQVVMDTPSRRRM